MKNLTLVMPAKNEAECLPTVLEELKNFECKKIIVIPRNDLNTQNVVKNLNCKILLQDSDGYGNALIEGINTVETEFFCIFNADHSFDPKYLDGMLHDLKNNYDFLFNSRYEKEGGSEDDTFLTYIGNKIFTLLCNILFRLNISDVLFTYVMGKTSTFKLLELKSKDFSFCVELPVLAKYKNYKLGSKSCYERPRLSGRKKVNEFKDGFLILLRILKLFIFRK